MKTLFTSLRLFLLLSLLTGVLYPLVITAVGQLAWPHKTQGSLLWENGKLRGSSLLAQKFSSATYFHSRPSASDYATLPSGASHRSPTNEAFVASVTALRNEWGPEAPVDLLTTSGSGLDPHLSKKAIEYQLPRICEARHLSSTMCQTLQAWVGTQVEIPRWGFMGKPQFNVLHLNLNLDKALSP